MGSSRHMRLWLRNDAGVWVEVRRFLGMRASDGLNFIPEMSVTIFAPEGTTAALLTGKRLFRLTKTNSTDGINGTRVMTGRLAEPDSDMKTNLLTNDRPVVFNVQGYGLAMEVGKTFYDAARDLPSVSPPGTAKEVINDDPLGFIPTVNATAPGTLVAGTIDTGPTILVRVRKASIFQLLLDIASLGDTTNDFSYIIDVDHLSETNFKPRINYRNPFSAFYETADPFAPRDEGRILDQKELRGFLRHDERDRIRNAIKVKFAGMATGRNSSEFPVSGFLEDATSITTFGRREQVVWAPWIQDSATAQSLAETLLATYKGDGVNGLRRFTAVLKFGGLFTTDFDAILGDVVGIEKGGVEVARGRFHQWEYEQTSESLTIHLGPQRVPFYEGYAQLKRQSNETFEAIERSTQKPTQPESDGSGQSFTAPTGASVVVADGATGVLRTIAANALHLDADGFKWKMTINPDGAWGGPMTWIVTLSGTEILAFTTENLKSGKLYETLGAYPFGVSGGSGNYALSVVNRSGASVTVPIDAVTFDVTQKPRFRVDV